MEKVYVGFEHDINTDTFTRLEFTDATEAFLWYRENPTFRKIYTKVDFKVVVE